MAPVEATNLNALPVFAFQFMQDVPRMLDHADRGGRLSVNESISLREKVRRISDTISRLPTLERLTFYQQHPDVTVQITRGISFLRRSS
jgi:uncharacterized metal-binding protein YceD (DUF177 family)